MFKSKNGSTVITAPIIIALGMIMVTILVLLTVEIIMPYLWYEKLSSSCIKYIYVMEEFGYLTNREINELKSDLKRQGFDSNRLNIKCTNNKTNYGEPIFLELVYEYEMKLPLMEPQIIEMQVERTSVSKR